VRAGIENSGQTAPPIPGWNGASKDDWIWNKFI